MNFNLADSGKVCLKSHNRTKMWKTFPHFFLFFSFIPFSCDFFTFSRTYFQRSFEQRFESDMENYLIYASFFASLMRSFSSLHFSCRRGSVTLRKIYGFFESTMNVPFNFIVRCIFQNDFFFSLCTSGKTKCIFFCKIVFTYVVMSRHAYRSD